MALMRTSVFAESLGLSTDIGVVIFVEFLARSNPER